MGEGPFSFFSCGLSLSFSFLLIASYCGERTDGDKGSGAVWERGREKEEGEETERTEGRRPEEIAVRRGVEVREELVDARRLSPS